MTSKILKPFIDEESKLNYTYKMKSGPDSEFWSECYFETLSDMNEHFGEMKEYFKKYNFECICFHRENGDFVQI